MNSTQLIALTTSLMQRAHIPIRDTYQAGDELLLDWQDSALQATGTGVNPHVVSGRKSIGYDGFHIVLPTRFRDPLRIDAAVHECVHFLQHQTIEEEAAYFSAQPTDLARYLQYLCQRVEVEAHFAQLLFVFDNSADYLPESIDESQESTLRLALAECLKPNINTSVRQQFVIRCKVAKIV